MTDVAISGSSTAGIYYLKNVGDSYLGHLWKFTGAGIKFGSATTQRYQTILE
jgi:hypothetical protein